ncbi:hypothetical protein C8Q78DRAFT_51691 [Trametes maxima]|nr:hypothetical protein C8Q78DRAFT_51691 [Trametes maxima]
MGCRMQKVSGKGKDEKQKVPKSRRPRNIWPPTRAGPGDQRMCGPRNPRRGWQSNPTEANKGASRKQKESAAQICTISEDSDGQEREHGADNKRAGNGERSVRCGRVWAVRHRAGPGPCGVGRRGRKGVAFVRDGVEETEHTGQKGVGEIETKAWSSIPFPYVRRKRSSMFAYGPVTKTNVSMSLNSIAAGTYARGQTVQATTMQPRHTRHNTTPRQTVSTTTHVTRRVQLSPS